MNLIGIRLERYRSFEDSRWIEVSSSLTILIGKNGSGKSSILEALSSLSGQMWTYPSDAQPVWTDDEPQLTLRYSTTPDEFSEILAAARLSADKNLRALLSGIEAHVTASSFGVKSYDEKFDESKLDEADAEERKQAFQNVITAYNKVLKVGNASYRAKLDENSDWMVIRDAASAAERLINAASSGTFDQAARELRRRSDEFYQAHSYLRLRDEVARRIASFLLLARAKLPETLEVEVSKVQEHRIFNNLFAAFDIRPEAMSKLTAAKRRNQTTRISRELTAKAQRLWTQDSIEFKFDFIGNMLTLAVTIDGTYFSYDQLSSGTAWFVDFLLQVIARERNAGESIMLFDEPGQYVHPVAQRQIYSWLSELATNQQVIYSTHSPYLFSALRLDQIRPVTKGPRSSVENSIYCTTDAETLSPILDVLGFPASGAFGIASNHNVICEGPSDYFYLSAMQRFLKFASELRFIPCVGASRAQHIVSILHGWRLPYLVVVDNDAEGKKVKRYLEKFKINNVITISGDPGVEIEDLFDPADFDSHVIADPGVKRAPHESNGDFVARLPGGKRAFARRFADRAERIAPIALKSTTLSNFGNLLAAVEAHFSAEGS